MGALCCCASGVALDLEKLGSVVGRAGLEPATNGLPTRRFGWCREQLEELHLRRSERVQRDETRMERDLNAARRIQSALLPRLPGPEFGLEIAAMVRKYYTS